MDPITCRQRRDCSTGSTIATSGYVAVVCLLLFVQSASGSPTKVQSQQTAHRAASPVDSLVNIVRDLEDAVFRLKEYALKADLESTQKDAGDVDSYPEIVTELQAEKKAAPPSGNVPPAAVSGSQPAKSPTTVADTGKDGKEDDISLREALEFLMSLAKQKKQDRRDHDIPFP